MKMRQTIERKTLSIFLIKKKNTKYDELEVQCVWWDNLEL